MTDRQDDTDPTPDDDLQRAVDGIEDQQRTMRSQDERLHFASEGALLLTRDALTNPSGDLDIGLVAPTNEALRDIVDLLVHNWARDLTRGTGSTERALEYINACLEATENEFRPRPSE